MENQEQLEYSLEITIKFKKLQEITQMLQQFWKDGNDKFDKSFKIRKA